MTKATTRLLARSGLASAASSILIAVRIRNAPKTKTIQWKVAISVAPSAIRIARMTRAPMMPQNRTRCWYSAGTAKWAKIRTKTKTLSRLSDFSMR